MHPSDRSTQRPGTGRTAVAAAGCLFLLAGCGVLPNWDSEEVTPEEEPAPPPPPSPEVLATHPRTTPPGLHLVEARGHFLAGQHEEAARAYRTYLNTTPSVPAVLADGEENPRRPESALWDLALLHLLPDSPLHDRQAAVGLLEELTEDHGGTVHGIQASWLLETLSTLDEMRTRAAERAEDIQELQESIQDLEETVEELRRLHLERRPRLPPADTLDGEGPPP